LNFNGTSGYVNAGNGASMTNLPKLSVSVWVKANSYGGGGQGFVVAKSLAGTGGVGWNLKSIKLVIIIWSFRPITTQPVSTACPAQGTFSAADFGTWTHVVVTWDGSNQPAGVHFYKKWRGSGAPGLVGKSRVYSLQERRGRTPDDR